MVVFWLCPSNGEVRATFGTPDRTILKRGSIKKQFSPANVQKFFTRAKVWSPEVCRWMPRVKLCLIRIELWSIKVRIGSIKVQLLLTLAAQ
jgi:hypothetical protein